MNSRDLPRWRCCCTTHALGFEWMWTPLGSKPSSNGFVWQSFDVDRPHIVRNPHWHGVSLTSSTGRADDDASYRSGPIEACNRLTEIASIAEYATSLTLRFAPVTRCRFYRLAPGG